MNAPDAFRTLYDFSPTPMLTAHADGSVVDANPAFCELMRTSRDELVGSPFTDAFAAHHRGAGRVYLRQALDRGEARWSVTLANAASASFDVRAVSFLGQVVVLMFSVPPVREAPQPLVPALAALAGRTPGQAVLLLSSDLWVVGAWGLADTVGIDDDAVMGRRLGSVVEAGDGWFAELTRALAAQESWLGQVPWVGEGVRVVRCDGHLVPSRVIGSRRGAGFLVVRPAGGREADIAGDQRRARRMARVGEFAVRLVDGVRDRTRALVRAAPDSHDRDRSRRDLDALDRRLKHFTELARIEGSVEVGRLLDGAEGRWGVFLAEQGIRLIVDREGTDPAVGIAVAEEVAGAVLDELIDNARVAVADHPEPRVRVTIDTEPEAVRITVTDSGPGLPPGDVEALFRPFHSLRKGHLGLGLAAARVQLELRGGQVVADAASSRASAGGGRFTATLPTVAERPAGLASPMLAGRTVLVVDESDDDRRVLSHILQAVGMEVRETWSGRSALADLAQHGAADAIVFSGGERTAARFLAELREGAPELAARTVVVTDAEASSDPETLESRLGCAAVSRPLVVEQLLECLEGC